MSKCKNREWFWTHLYDTDESAPLTISLVPTFCKLKWGVCVDFMQWRNKVKEREWPLHISGPCKNAFLSCNKVTAIWPQWHGANLHEIYFLFCWRRTGTQFEVRSASINKSHHSLTLVPRAARKPIKLKLSSLQEQRASPPITGINDRFTYTPVTSPERKNHELFTFTELFAQSQVLIEIQTKFLTCEYPWNDDGEGRGGTLDGLCETHGHVVQRDQTQQDGRKPGE